MIKNKLRRRQEQGSGATGDFLGKDKEYFPFIPDNTRPRRLREPARRGVFHNWRT
jgi:hypothetical protein